MYLYIYQNKWKLNKNDQLEFEILHELLKQFEAALELNETVRFDEEEFETIIMYYLQTNRPQLALEASDMALVLYPFSSEFCLTKADAHIELGDLDLAEEYLTTNFKIDKSDKDYYILLSEIYVLRNNFDKAIEICELGLARCSENIDLLYLHLAEIHDHQGDYSKAIPILIQAIKANPKNEDALYLYSITMTLMDRIHDKAVFFQKLTDADPFNDEAWYYLGVTYRELGLYEKAIECLEYIHAIDEDITVLGDMAQVYFEAGNYEMSIASLKELEKEGSLESLDLQVYAKSYRELGNMHKAKIYLKEALSIDESNDDIYYELAKTYFQDNKYAAALPLILKALEKSKDIGHYIELKADILLGLERVEEACELYRDILLQHNSSTYYISKFAYILALEYSLEEAIDILDTGIASEQNASLYYHKAVLYFIFHKEEEAYLAFSLGLQHDFDSHTILFEKLPEMEVNDKIRSLLSLFGGF